MKTIIFSIVGLFFSFNASADCSAFCVNQSKNPTGEITVVKAKTVDGLFRLCHGAQTKLLQSNDETEPSALPMLSLPLKLATAENSCGEAETDTEPMFSLDDSLEGTDESESL